MVRKQLDVDFFTPEVIAEPYPVYEQIRAVGDVVWNGLLQAWMIVGFDEASELLNHPGFVEVNGDPELIYWFEAPNMITVDGEYHQRLRAPLYPFFTRSAVARWEKRVGEVVDSMLEPLVRGSSSFDLIADFTKLPTIIVAELLGVPEERHADFRRWSHEIVSNMAYGGEGEDRQAVMRRAAREVNDYLREEVERHRRERPGDLLTALVDLEEQGAMSADEIRSTAVLLLLAAYDTTAKTMSDCLISLAANPEQRRLVAADLSLVPDAIEEAMRWNGAVQFNLRSATSDAVVGGTEIAGGETVYVFYAAANRDPRRWPSPERFDVRRDRKTHLAFGRGPHMCLGAPLARLEVKVALERLLSAAPNFELNEIDYGVAFFIRGPEKGVVAVGEPGSGAIGS